MKTTTLLMNKLIKTNNFEKYANDENDKFISATPAQILGRMFRKSGLKKNEVIWRSCLSAPYVHQIFSGRKIPSRDSFVALCVSMEASLDETQTALKAAGLAQLYSRSLRDAVIIYGICNRLSVCEINGTLFDKEFETIS